VQLSRFLGFFPEGKYAVTTPIFDMQEGKFVGSMPSHSLYMDAHQSNMLNELINAEYGSIHFLKIDKNQRKQLLQSLVKFYQLHITSFGEIKSLEILEQISS
jgi:DNA repair protein RecO (recombination protein O)